jgi:hypothetical protein
MNKIDAISVICNQSLAIQIEEINKLHKGFLTVFALKYRGRIIPAPRYSPPT